MVGGAFLHKYTAASLSPGWNTLAAVSAFGLTAWVGEAGAATAGHAEGIEEEIEEGNKEGLTAEGNWPLSWCGQTP